MFQIHVKMFSHTSTEQQRDKSTTESKSVTEQIKSHIISHSAGILHSIGWYLVTHVTKYQPMLSSDPEDEKPHLHHGRSLQSCKERDLKRHILSSV